MTNIVIAGVGGQGSILAARILGDLFMSRGMDVKVNEIHGMSQRGGSVITTVRAGEQIFSPLITPGTADLLIGLEMIEAARNLRYLSSAGHAVISKRIIPIRQTGEASSIGLIGGLSVDAQALATESGNAKCENTVLLGAASKYLDFTQDEWEQVITKNVKPEHLQVNLKAFELGQQAVPEGDKQ